MSQSFESRSDITASQAGEFWAGVRAITPLVLGAIPFGIIFGALATANGITAPATAALSALVFAGSSQFVAAGMVAAGASVAVIVLTTFVVNLRHALYGVTLGTHLRGLPQRWLVPLGFLLTDEAFMVVIQRYSRRDASPFKHWYYLGAATFMYVNWQVFTFIGIWAGQSIANPRSWGLDFAFPLTFIGMLVPSLTTRPLVLCALSAGMSALILRGLPHQFGLIVAAVVGVTAGVLAELRARRSGSGDSWTEHQERSAP